MVESRIAVWMEEQYMYNRKGIQVNSVEHVFGLLSEFKLVKPNFLLFVDECRCNTNQKGDNRVGGELYVMPTVGSAEDLHGATIDIHFTTLGITAGTGEPVMPNSTFLGNGHRFYG